MDPAAESSSPEPSLNQALCGRKGHDQTCASQRAVVHAHPTAQVAHDFGNDGQAQPGALIGGSGRVEARDAAQRLR